MSTAHTALLEIVTFDLVIGFLYFQYLRSAPYPRRRLVPFSVGLIGALVNANLFLDVSTVEVAVTLGGCGLISLLLGRKSNEGNSADPAASATPPALSSSNEPAHPAGDHS